MVCITVLTYVFGGGMRSLSFANAVHASVLILLGGVILFLIVGKLGGADAASALVAKEHPNLLVRGEGQHPIGHMEFLTYMFVPLVGRHVSASLPTLDDRQGREDFPPGGDPASDLHHARLGPLRPAGHLGLDCHAQRHAGHSRQSR